MSVEGKIVNRENMGKFYNSCFDPNNMVLSIYKGKEKYKAEKRDFTLCYYRSKLEKYEDKECQNVGVVNGVATTTSAFIDVLMSDIPICKIPNSPKPKPNL